MTKKGKAAGPTEIISEMIIVMKTVVSNGKLPCVI